MAEYLMYPSISKESIAFTSDDDLWIYDTHSKTVKSIVSGFGTITHPVFSPDGEHIAFRVSRGDTEPISEIYVCNKSGGDLKRITWIGSSITDTVGWNKNGKVIIVSDDTSPFMRETFLFEIDPKDLSKNLLPVGPATGMFFSDKGTFVLRGIQDLTYWKGYRGGTRGKIWFDHDNGGKYHKFLELETGVYSPVYVKGRVYFITDSDGRGNIYSVDRKGKDLKQHTHFKDYYARNLSTDGTRISFQMGGEIYTFHPESDKTEKVGISVPIKGSNSKRRFVDPIKYLEEFQISPDGNKVTFTVRGKGFSFSTRLNKSINIDPNSNCRMRELKVIKNGRLFFISDDRGTEKLYVKDKEEDKKAIFETESLLEKIFPSPEGKYVAVSTNRFELYMVDVTTGTSEKLLENKFGVIENVSWHPTENWIAASIPESSNSRAIFIIDVQDGTLTRATSSGFNDFFPAFGPTGLYLYYLSDRNLDPVYDKITFDLGFPKVTLPFVISLLSSKRPPFIEGRDADEPSPPTVKINQTIDLINIQARSVQVPLNAYDYTAIYPTKESLYLIRFPTEGALKHAFLSQSTRQDGELVRFDFRNSREKVLLRNITDAKLSLSGRSLAVRKGSEFTVEDLTKFDDEIKESDQDRSVRLDLSKLKCAINPRDEWTQMFLETWRLMKENYWDENKIKKNWNSVRDKYLQLLKRVNTRFEASDVIKEMQGETGTSHSYERKGEIFTNTFHPVGKLGADIEKRSDGFYIKSILTADPSLESERSPLIAPGIDIREGDKVVAINGIPLHVNGTYESLLENLAEDHTDIKVESGTGRNTYDVKPLTSETELRYRSWVESNRKYVHEKSKGKVGYVHIPDMGPIGFSEFFRLYRSEWDHDSLIVDVRFNGGGHVSQLILEKLNRQLIGYDIPRRGDVEPYPLYAVRGGIVAVTNEYAGSDGDIFSHSFKLLGIGPLIGTRTWGGVVGINPRRTLVDGTFVTQPEFSFWFKDVGYTVENYGTDPTMLVEISPDQYGRNEDPQLDAAIHEALKKIPENKKPYEKDKE